MKNEVVLFTAGIDSYILREYLVQHGHDVDCLYFTHGGRYTGWEQIKIDSMPFEVIKNDMLLFKDIERDDAFIPNRNILMTVAANSLGYEMIWIGGSKSDRVNDNNENVFFQLSNFLRMLNGRPIKIDSPFWDCYKDDMVSWYSKVKKPTDLVYNTFSCFNPVARNIEHEFRINDSKLTKYETSECLKCAACFRKCAALYSAGIYIQFDNGSIVNKYEDEFKNVVLQDARSVGTLNYIQKLRSELPNAG